MAGIDDKIAVIGDWVPPSPSSSSSPSPSPRTFFAGILGDDMSSREPPSENGADGPFLGSQEQMTSGNTVKKDMMQAGASNDLGRFSGLKSRLAARAGFNAPRLNTESIRSSELSLNPDVRSPYMTMPPGLSPTTLLESPVFLSTSLVQPSPTTGKFPFIPNGNGKSSTFMMEALDKSKGNIFEDINTSFAESGSFSLGVTKEHSIPSIEISVQSENSHQSLDLRAPKVRSQCGNNLNLQTNFSRALTEKDNGCNTILADQRAFGTVGGSTERSPPLDERQDEEGDQRGNGDSVVAGGGGASSDDGYNWRKYGQKQVKGSEYPRSYYKCTHPNCQVKKKVERSHEGHITEIIYKGAHNHLKPPPNRRSAVGSNPLLDMQLEISEHAGLQSGTDGDPVYANTQKETTSGTPEWGGPDNVEGTSLASVGPEYCNQSSSLPAPNGNHFESGDAVDASSTFSNDEDEDDRATHGSVGYDGEEDESESKRRKIEAYATEMSGATRAIREPRVVVQTTSEVDILDDGYRWRKYGQKVVKGNPNPRSYYKCTSAGCTVRKHVERASHDLKSVITTYEGKHNHDVPAARNSSHINSVSSSGVTAHAAAGQIHRPEPSQMHSSMARFERPTSFGSFRVPGRQQLGPLPGFSFGMNQTGLANLAMAGRRPRQAELPVLPVHPYLAQQRQVSEMGFTRPKGEPKVEPISEPGLNLSNRSAVYQQLMSRLPLGPQM